MITRTRAKELAQQAWDTGVFIKRPQGVYMVKLPQEHSAITWRIKGGEVKKVAVCPLIGG